MNDIRKQLLEIAAGVRAHLEYQRALGVRAVGIGPAGADASAAPDATSGAPVPAPSAAVPGEGLEDIRRDMGDCTRCRLHGGRKTIVFGEGSPKAPVVFVGEGPGYEEDQQGRPFVGAAGQLLTDIIVKGMKLRREDVYICNIVKCRPPNNRNPEPDEVESCIGFVKRQIAAIGPKVIVTLGNVPTRSLLNTTEGITRLRGAWREYEGIPVMPTFHPSYLLRSPGAKKEVWIDIKKVLRKLGMDVPDKK
jgi:uracil-DNA glycosylase family 4